LKKNSQKRDIQKLKEGDFYRNMFGMVFQIVNINWDEKIAVVKFTDVFYETKWDFEDFPIDLERAKLTPLEVELL
jgi:hypothetical protein